MLMMLARAVTKCHRPTGGKEISQGSPADADDARPCGHELPPAGRWERDLAGKSS